MKFAVQSGRMRRKTNEPYLRQAAKAFLQGLPYASPVAAVEAGARSLADWCECLNQTRARYGLHHDPLLNEAWSDQSMPDAGWSMQSTTVTPRLYSGRIV